jgi:hypothetical protein
MTAVVVPLIEPVNLSCPALVVHEISDVIADGVPNSHDSTTISAVILLLLMVFGSEENAPTVSVRILFSRAFLAVVSLMLYVTPSAVIWETSAIG